MVTRRYFIIPSSLVFAGFMTAAQPVLAKSKTLNGTVHYDEQVPVPIGSVLEVAIEDVSFADKKSKVIAKTKLKTKGVMPINYSLKYEDKALKRNGRYALTARIVINGETALLTTAHHPVEAGAPIDGKITLEKISE